MLSLTWIGVACGIGVVGEILREGGAGNEVFGYAID